MPQHTVFFVHAAGDPRHPEGSGRLIDYLGRELGSDYRVLAPTMPDPDHPRYSPWRNRIGDDLATLDGSGDVILVGHSFGGSVLLKYLSEGAYQEPIRGLFLVSVPWWGPEGWDYEEFAVPDDFGARLPPAPIFLYHSRDDPEVPFVHLALYEERLPEATSRALAGTEHSFLDGLPELVRDIKLL
jgi:predicted alpha/beta hydrolase family esterase